jgi:CubicO group peptidase (beta-lactamase class C family)
MKPIAMKKKGILLVLMACWLGGSAQQTTGLSQQRLQRIDTFVQQQIRNQHITGATVLVMYKGKAVYNRAFGFADVAAKTPMQTDNIFRIASQTKAITSLAVMMLWEEGKFLLDAPVSRYIPAFKTPSVLKDFNPADSSYTSVPATREITIRDLLRHTSGIDYAGITGDARMRAIYAKAGVRTGIGTKGTVKANVERLAALPLKHNPGEAFTYGLNTDVLGYLVEIWSGMPLNEFCSRRIFAPLGMHDTYFHLPASKAGRLVAVQQRGKDGILTKVTGPIFDGVDPLYPLDTTVYPSGGAALSSTTADYAKFLQLLINKGQYNGQRLVSAATIDLMLRNQLQNIPAPGMAPDFQFGLGVAVVTPRNHYLYPDHIGSFWWGGVLNTHYWADPEAELCGLIYTQEYQPGSYNDDLAFYLRALVYGALNSNY